VPRRPGRVPSYCLHKHSGQAVVRIGGHDKHLGRFGSPESYEQYERAIAEWRTHCVQSSGSSQEAPATNGSASLTTSGLILDCWEFARTYYVKDGQPTKELACMKEALRPLRRLYGQPRRILLGPRAQQILEPFLNRDPKAYLFSPREADAWWRNKRRTQRRTPMTPSQARRRRKANPKRAKRDRYDTRTYRQAITYRCSYNMMFRRYAD